MSARACPCTLILLVLLVAGTSACRQPVEQVFRFSSDAPSRAGLVALEDGVLVANEAGALVRLGQEGATRWRVALGREVATRPARAGDSVVAGTVAGELVRLSLADGAVRWRLTGQPPVLTPLVSDGASVYAVAPDGAVRAHAVDTGQVRWRWSAPGPAPTRPPPAPVLAGGLLVVALEEAGLFALSTKDGAVRWQRPVARVLGLEAGEGVLYAATRDGRVLALGMEDGAPRWEQHPAAALTGPPTLALGRLWVGVEPSQLLGLAPGNGQETARLSLPSPLVTQVAVHQGLLLVPTRGREGRLLALRPEGGPPAFSVRLDTPLRTLPVVRGDLLFVAGLDGRVLAWRIRAPER